MKTYTQFYAPSELQVDVDNRRPSSCFTHDCRRHFGRDKRDCR